MGRTAYNADEEARGMAVLLERMVRAVVRRAEEVTIESIAQNDRTILRLTVAPGDIGRVIGSQGRIARSIRTILNAAGQKVGTIYTLDVVVPHDPKEAEDTLSSIAKIPHPNEVETGQMGVSPRLESPAWNPDARD